ncbi:Ran-binding protein 9 [Halotydeus destructor]|nr:Ran-binding protein 9 [Halotydeus destructor]
MQSRRLVKYQEYERSKMHQSGGSLSGGESMQTLFSSLTPLVDTLSRLKSLYPHVDVGDLPTAWSSKDKANFISLSESNLKVHYKGVGKGHRDAAAVRATHPIPAACYLYYFEIKVISKGRDGYMGVGLAAQGVNNQRLPGWDKQSYGYHGDDGHSFCASGTGQPYGPTFTTGDVIGCGYNLVENTCFYTKNGLNLGVAFSDLPPVPLYPTVGLQTPGEEVEANFGTEPFIYDIEDDIKALRQRITSSVINYPVRYNEWQSTVHKLVKSWLVHNGYCTTAEAFCKSTKQEFKENASQIKQRFRIQQLVLSGKIGEATQLTSRVYPEVLKDNPNLLFALKCRQFIEMIAGADDFKSANHSSPLSCLSTSACSSPGTANGASSNPGSEMNGVTTNDHMEIDEEYSSDANAHVKNVLNFGKELHQLSQNLKKHHHYHEQNTKILEDAFSLLAYSDPFNSPVGWQLDPSERETVAQQLNNAIVSHEVGTANYKPPLETIMKHTKSLLRMNGQSGAWLMDNL